MAIPDDAAAQLRARLNAGPGREADLTSALAVADALLTEHLTTRAGDVVTVIELPEALHTETLLDVASRVFRLRASENGSIESAVLDGPALTLSPDPLHTARRTLAPWTGTGIA